MKLLRLCPKHEVVHVKQEVTQDSLLLVVFHEPTRLQERAAIAKTRQELRRDRLVPLKRSIVQSVDGTKQLDELFQMQREALARLQSVCGTLAPARREEQIQTEAWERTPASARGPGPGARAHTMVSWALELCPLPPATSGDGPCGWRAPSLDNAEPAAQPPVLTRLAPFPSARSLQLRAIGGSETLLKLWRQILEENLCHTASLRQEIPAFQRHPRLEETRGGENHSFILASAALRNCRAVTS